MTMRGAGIAAAIVLGGAPGAAAQAIGTVHGTVVDRATGAPVVGAIVAIGDELVATDDAGAFSIALPPGRYTIAVSADFLAPTTAAVVIATGTTTAVTIAVDPAPRAGGETIGVTALAPSAPGQTTVSAALARALPGGGDAAKVVQSLPAVARPAAGSTDIVVWGAAPSETRVFVDGVPVPSLYHLGGYRAAIGNDLLGDLRLTPAAFGADRGGAIGGVIDIAIADPASVPEWRVQADVLDVSASGRATLGGVTIAAAIRQSWLDRAIGLVEDPKQLAPNAPLPRWTDAQLAIRARLARDVVLSGWAIASLDTLDRTLVSDDPATKTDESLDQAFVRAQVTVRRDRANGFDSATLWAGRDRTTDDYLFGTIPADLADRAWVGGARGAQQTRLGDHATVTAGVDVDAAEHALARDGSLSIPAREGDVHIFGQAPGSAVAADAWHAATVDAAGYATVDVRVGRLTATVGGRLDSWLLTASRLTPRVAETPAVASQQILLDVDPRAQVQLRLTDDAVVHVDAGRYHQARDASDTSAVFGTPNLGLEDAWHAIAGAQWRRGAAALELAGYARWEGDLVARDLAVTPPLAASLTQLGIGHVYGVQATARVLAWRGLSGWVSYNRSRSTRRDAPTDDWRLFDHDQTNGLIAVAAWERGPWTLGARVRYATGEPRTPVIGALFDSATGRYQPVVGVQNSVRLPAFFAADLRGQRAFGLPALGAGAHGAVYVEVQNLTDRANAEEIIYNADFTQKGYLTSLPLLAIAGVRIER